MSVARFDLSSRRYLHASFWGAKYVTVRGSASAVPGLLAGTRFSNRGAVVEPTLAPAAAI